MNTNRSVTKQDSQVSDKRVKLKGGPDAILDAAEDLIRTGGMERLTIGGVASAVDVTKAGVLHHFSNRRGLVRALIERDHQRFAASLSENLSALKAKSGASSRDLELAAYAASVLSDAETADSLRLSLTLACLIDPSLIEDLDVAKTTPWEALDPSDDNDVAYALKRLAYEGLWLNRILKIGLPDDLETKIIKSLEKIDEPR